MKNFKKAFTASLLLSFILAFISCANKESGSINQEKTEEGSMTEYYTFELSDNVTRESVSYKNRYGITIAGDLYMAKNIDTNQKHPAIIVGPPYGGVKEQGAGIYANELAKRGFIVLAFDPAYNGESGGSPRNISSPDIFVENFSAGVDYLGTRDFVDREKIGAIGICGSGGFAISAAQMDSRIKAIATSVMYDMSSFRNPDPNEFNKMREALSLQRWVDFENGTMEYIPSFPGEAVDTVPEGLDPVNAEFFSYYGLKRGHHPNARGGFTTTSQSPFFNFQLLNHIKTVSPRPILFVVGENAHSRGFSEIAYAEAAEPKEIHVVPNANHVDLYDDTTKIPFDKLEEFFNGVFN